MVRRRGAPRRSSPRRRTYRTRIKWDPHIIPYRFKKLLPMMSSELDWEIEVQLLLEEDVYPYLEAQGVPSDQWEYYIAFARRMWNRRVHFTSETFQIEKQILVNEFITRGLNATHLGTIQLFAEEWAQKKLLKPPLEVGTLGGVTVFGDDNDMAYLAGVTVELGVVP